MATGKGSGLLPPNPKQWSNEKKALALRAALSIGLELALDVEAAFAALPNVFLFPHGQLPLTPEEIVYVRGPGRAAWSAMAVHVAEMDLTLVTYNDSHSRNRIRASLMEEYFHLHLGHPATRVRVYAGDGRLRTWDSKVEKEAYDCGAAALVPFQPLKSMILAGFRPNEIARRFEVSEDLVIYRVKITRQYSALR